MPQSKRFGSPRKRFALRDDRRVGFGGSNDLPRDAPDSEGWHKLAPADHQHLEQGERGQKQLDNIDNIIVTFHQRENSRWQPPWASPAWKVFFTKCGFLSFYALKMGRKMPGSSNPHHTAPLLGNEWAPIMIYASIGLLVLFIFGESEVRQFVCLFVCIFLHPSLFGTSNKANKNKNNNNYS